VSDDKGITSLKKFRFFISLLKLVENVIFRLLAIISSLRSLRTELINRRWLTW